MRIRPAALIIENNHVLNHVFVHDLIGLKLAKIGEGGFSNIYRT